MSGYQPRSYEGRPVLTSGTRRAWSGCLRPGVRLTIVLALAALAISATVMAMPAAARETVVYPDILITAEDLLHRLSATPGQGDAGDPEPGDAAEPVPGWRLLDARSGERYGWGRIPGAIPLDPGGWLGRLDPEELHRRLKHEELGFSILDTVVCYSGRESPAAAGALFWILETAGHPAVRVLNGGFEAWTTARGAIETERSPSAAARFSARPDTTRVADFDYVLGHFGRPGYSVLDVRTPEKWAKGHIPHSLPFPLETLVGDDGLWLSGKEMRELFAVWGPRDREYVDLNDEFIVLGDDFYGHQPIHPYLAARLAGIKKVRVYREGFSGWRYKDNAPVTRLIGIRELRTHLRKQWGKRFRETDLPPADVILLDMRGVGEYAAGHIPGALQLSPHRFEEDFEALVAEYWPGADRATVPVVAYCYGPTCTRSRFGTTWAAQHGFKNVEWFKDGVLGWRQAGEELVKPE